jgi:Tfp pilus assembly protein PilX
MENLKLFIRVDRKNQEGYVIVSSLMVLMLITIIGVMSVRTSNSDIEISANHHIFGRSFYAAGIDILGIIRIFMVRAI